MFHMKTVKSTNSDSEFASIDADFRNERFIGKLSPRPTQYTPFYVGGAQKI